MELNININLSDEDIREGFTAQDVVEMLFPAGVGTVQELNLPEAFEEPEVEIQEDEAEQEAQEDADIAKYEATVQPPAVSISNEQQEEVNEEEEPAPGSLPPRDDHTELDSAGVPWDSEIHSSGRSQYQSGPDKGRWIWKRGSDPVERERIAQILKEEVAPRAPAVPVKAPVSPAVTVPPAPIVPRPDNVSPAPAAPVPEQPAAASGAGVLTSPVDWKTLLNALDQHGIEATTTADALAAIGVDQIALLANDDASDLRDALARELGLL